MSLTDYHEDKPYYMRRILWWIVNRTLFYMMIGTHFKKSRNVLLRLFGAKIGNDGCVYNTCIIYAPWKLDIGSGCIGPHVKVYNKDIIVIGNETVVSQYSYLCTASHHIDSLMLPLKTAPIVIGNHVWIAADTFVGPGVTIGDGAVVGARAAVFKNVDPWTVVGGNPAKSIKKRVITGSDE